MSLGAGGERKRYEAILRNIAMLLHQAGIKFGYLYEEELYTGALFYDEGVDEVFMAHAHFVYERLKTHGVKTAITVDPHTTNMLRSVYPEIIEDYSLEVKTYIEALAEAGYVGNAEVQEVVVHDSCIYARSENVLEQPRSLLEAAGMSIKEPELSGKLTHCCGGPLESLFPDRASRDRSQAR